MVRRHGLAPRPGTKPSFHWLQPNSHARYSRGECMVESSEEEQGVGSLRLTQQVNQVQTEVEREALRQSVQRDQPYGDTGWMKQVATRLGLEPTLHPRTRPRKADHAVK